MKFIDKTKAFAKFVIESIRTAVESAPPELRKPAKKLLIGAVIIFVVISTYKYVSYKREEYLLAKEVAAGPIVRVSKVMQSPGEHKTTVIGETRPYQSVTLYAKVSGYLKSVRVDKGDIVKKGEIIAVIESPETDQAYAAALANGRNKRDIGARMKLLRDKKLVSEQEFEQAQSDADVAAAQFHSEETLKGYEILRAPFDGTVTARFADPGALVQNATSSQSSSLPVVTVSQINRLRVDVFLDQREAPFVVKDEPVEISISERPGVKIQGRVDRLSQELDPRTKMMLTEIDIPNDQGTLVAGSFVQVALKIKSPPYLEAPVESMILKQEKTFLAVVTPDHTISYRPVQIVSNDGKILWILNGVQDGEMVALSAANVVEEGGKIRPIMEQAPPVAAPVATPSAPAPNNKNL